MDTKIEIGQENISFEMESKQEDNAVTYDSVVFRKDTLQAKPNVETQPYKDSDTLNSPCHFDFSCDNHDGTERGFNRYGCHCSFLLWVNTRRSWFIEILKMALVKHVRHDKANNNLLRSRPFNILSEEKISGTYVLIWFENFFFIKIPRNWVDKSHVLFFLVKNPIYQPTTLA